jgi:hypothetical protein
LSAFMTNSPSVPVAPAMKPITSAGIGLNGVAPVEQRADDRRAQGADQPGAPRKRAADGTCHRTAAQLAARRTPGRSAPRRRRPPGRRRGRRHGGHTRQVDQQSAGAWLMP